MKASFCRLVDMWKGTRERGEGKRWGESCNNKWRSISPTLLKTVGHVLTTRRRANHDAWRHHRRSFNTGIFFMMRLFCIHPGHISTNLLPTKSDLANYLLSDNIEFDEFCEISMKANRFQNHFRVRFLLVKLRDIWSFLIHEKEISVFLILLSCMNAMFAEKFSRQEKCMDNLIN